MALLGDTAPAEQVTLFGNAVLLTRVPLFLFQAVQAALLPRLTRLAARGDIKEFRFGFKQLVILVFGVGLLGIVGAFIIGPNVLDLVYGGSIDRRTITLLALASGIYMMALAIAKLAVTMPLPSNKLSFTNGASAAIMAISTTTMIRHRIKTFLTTGPAP